MKRLEFNYTCGHGSRIISHFQVIAVASALCVSASVGSAQSNDEEPDLEHPSVLRGVISSGA
jgi:hypothetical protein